MRHKPHTDSDLTVKIYTSDPAIKKPLSFFQDVWKDVKLSFSLGYSLFVKDIKAQYRLAILGLSWLLIIPAMQIAIWYILFQNNVIAPGSDPGAYLAYMSVGVILWTIFSEAVNAPIVQGMNAKPILVKTNFPREALIISGLYQVMMNAVIRISLLIILHTIIGFKPDWNVLFFPLSVISLILAGTVVGMFLFPFAMLYSDISKALPILLQLGMFLSPVAFTASGTGMLSKIMQLNPLSVLIESGRFCMIGQGSASLSSFVTILIVSAGLLFLIWMIYRITLPLIIERISS